MTPNHPPKWQRNGSGFLTTADVEVYKGYQIEYQAREASGIVRVIANVTAQPLPVGRQPQRFAAEARDPADARIAVRGQATYWIDNVAPV